MVSFFSSFCFPSGLDQTPLEAHDLGLLSIGDHEVGVNLDQNVLVCPHIGVHMPCILASTHYMWLAKLDRPVTPFDPWQCLVLVFYSVSRLHFFLLRLYYFVPFCAGRICGGFVWKGLFIRSVDSHPRSC